jgi:guanine nucleotide-binding protein subunit alpha
LHQLNHTHSFFTDLHRLWARDYLPTDQDILRARLRTTGITETVFDVGSLIYKMFDVGGQRSERKKWIHVFDNVQAILFLVAISGYDSTLIEDRNGNQMEEALMLFDNIVNSAWFVKTAVILFLNKVDLFTEKVESGTSPIGDSFSDFKGPERNVKAGQDYFAGRFKGLVKNVKKETYVHFTNATDTDLLKKTMVSVQDMIVQRNLNELIL